jgi:hypothetical protein
LIENGSMGRPPGGSGYSVHFMRIDHREASDGRGSTQWLFNP